jgi:hypothetical protein
MLRMHWRLQSEPIIVTLQMCSRLCHCVPMCRRHFHRKNRAHPYAACLQCSVLFVERFDAANMVLSAAGKRGRKQHSELQLPTRQHGSDLSHRCVDNVAATGDKLDRGRWRQRDTSASTTTVTRKRVGQGCSAQQQTKWTWTKSPSPADSQSQRQQIPMKFRIRWCSCHCNRWQIHRN